MRLRRDPEIIGHADSAGGSDLGSKNGTSTIIGALAPRSQQFRPTTPPKPAQGGLRATADEGKTRRRAW